MSEKTKKSLVYQGSILAMAGLISKMIGFLYRIPMANIMGNTGNGVYSVAYGIYNIVLTLSSYSMPLAVSKLISERLAKEEYKNSHKLFKKAFIFAFVSGTIAAVVLFAGASTFASVYCKSGLERPLRILAPTTFVVALLGTCRGFFQGHKNMVPTAVSQIIEQIVNAVVSVLGASVCIRMCSNESELSSYGAMGGTMGTLAGATVALILFVCFFIRSRSDIREEASHSDEVTESNGFIYKCILLTVLPVIISQSIYQLGYTLDDLLFGNIMAIKGHAEDFVTSVQGVFNTQYNQMINLPTSIATAMAAATLPSVVGSFALKEYDAVGKKIDMIFKINMLIAIPSFAGLACLADPIMYILFPGLKDFHNTAVLLLQTGSSAVIFYSISTLTTSVLQGCNHMSTPVIHSGISLVLHGLIVGGLLYFTNIGVYALVIGNVTFPLLVSILNIASVKKLLRYKFDVMNTFVKPLLASVIMGIIIECIYYFSGAKSFGKIGMCATLVLLVVLAVCIYAVLLYLFKAFTKQQLKEMPIIKKFIK